MELSDYKVGIAVFFVLLALLAVLNPQPPVLETHSPSALAEKNYSIDGQSVVVKKTLSALGDGIAYKNTGTQSVEFGVIDVIPPSLAENSQEVYFSNSGTGKAKTDFFDNKEPPVLRHTSITLGPGETFERKTESRKFSLFPISQKPLHVFSNATLTAEEKKAFEPALRKASALAEQMSGEEREVFEEKLNNAMLKAKAQGNSVNETAQALEQFAGDVKKAKDEVDAKASPSAGASVSPSPANATQGFLDRLKQMNANIPKPSQQANASEFKFPELPEKIELEVSEDDPYDEVEFTANAIGDLGSALVRIESEDGSSMHLTATTSQTTPTQYDFTVDADFSDRDTDKYGLFDFDEGHAELIVFYSGFQAEPKTIPIAIKVNHISISEAEKLALDATVSQEEFLSAPVQNEPQYEQGQTPSTQCAIKAKQITDYAKTFVQKLKYKWGGTSLVSGADCSGFVQSIYAKFGIGIPRTAATQIGAGVAVNKKNLIPGDLVFLKNTYKKGVSHVAIYVGEGRVVDAPGKGQFVSYDSLYTNTYQQKYAGARRVIPECISQTTKK